MFKKEFIFVVLLFISGCASLPSNSEIIHYYQFETSKPYADILAELKIAIAEHNFRITGHSRIGKVIRDRGDILFPEYDTLQFCNLTHAKALLQISPHAVSHMPCNIVMYQLNNRTIVKTRLLPTTTDNNELNRFSAKINRILKKIVDFAIEE